MKKILYSVIVPTKNRYEYLIPLIELIESFENYQMELVVQDNSDNNEKILGYMKNKTFISLRYFYNPEHLSVVENSDLAIKHSVGKYVTFLGDDDFVSMYAFRYVEYMDKYEIESSIFNEAIYNWPGMQYVAHKFPSLSIKKFKGMVKKINIDDEYRRLLNRGALSLEKMPKVYHGIVSREKLDEIYNVSNSYFPGPSPDMANSVALSKVLEKHIYCDLPFVSTGASPKSTAGLGAKHKHSGNISDMKFLPDGVEERWNEFVPKIWTAPTIYAQSLTESVKAMGCEKDLLKFNYNYFYAALCSFCPEYIEYFESVKNKFKPFSKMKFEMCKIKIFIIRAKIFIINFVKTRLKRGAILVDDVPDTIKASEIVDKYLESIDIEELFLHIEGDQ